MTPAERQRGEEDQMAKQARQDAAEEARMLDPAELIEEIRRVFKRARPYTDIAETALSALEDIIKERDEMIIDLIAQRNTFAETIEGMKM